MSETWISTVDAAAIIGASESTVYRSVTRPAWRTAWWGEEGKGWRRRPTRRVIYQLSERRAKEIAANPPPIPKETDA